jgi:hypothetical protein
MKFVNEFFTVFCCVNVSDNPVMSVDEYQSIRLKLLKELASDSECYL